METAIDALAALEPQRMELEQERERMRAELGEARNAATAAQQHARELAVQVESRRSSHTALITTVGRLEKQLEDLHARRLESGGQIAGGRGADWRGARLSWNAALQQRAEIEAELRAAQYRLRRAWTACCASTMPHAMRWISAWKRRARASMRRAWLRSRCGCAARAWRNSSTATNFEFAALVAQIAADATVASWESQLEETKGKIERLGQVNLAAIGEFKEQSERKEYLDRQCKDLTDALETLESAMRKIDRETRTRFQDTFDRVNAGLKEKFPRLFGGGHAYLELTGEESAIPPASPSWRVRPANATAPSANCRAARRR